MAYFLPGARIGEVHGKASRVNGRLVVAMYHLARFTSALKAAIEADFSQPALIEEISKAMNRNSKSLKKKDEPKQLTYFSFWIFEWIFTTLVRPPARAGFRSSFRRLFPANLKRWYAHQKQMYNLISYPKCGRTWLELMIGKTICHTFSNPRRRRCPAFALETKITLQVEHITVVHDDRPMLKTPAELETPSPLRWQKGHIFGS